MDLKHLLMNLKTFCKTILDFAENATNYNPEAEVFFSVQSGEEFFLPTSIAYTKMFDGDDKENPIVVINIT